jgi:uncharacterized protein (DUF1015 family)
MAFVTGFKGTHFASGLLLNDLIIPPYDTLDSEAADHYRRKSPYNFSHVDLASKEEDDYSHSLTLLDQWSKKRITQETPSTCYFLYRQNFIALGKKHQRDTLLCTVGLADFSKGSVLPHENTFGKYKADRLQLLRKTQHNLSHIFGMVKDSEGFLAAQFEAWSFETPFLQAKGEDGVLHSIWKVDVSKAHDISSYFKDKPIYIVDGHHRYESALMYARELGVEGKFEHPASSTTFCIANTFDPGLIIYPTHRLLKKGSLQNFSLAKLENNYQLDSVDKAALERFTQTHRNEPCFAVLYQEKCWILTPKNWAGETKRLGQSIARLGVTWSDHHFLKEFCGVTDENRRELISYDKDFTSSWSQKSNVDLIVFHAPPAVTDVTAVADERKYMPQKSTFFIPKLAGGLIFRKF